MMHFLVVATALTGIGTGLFVLAFGDWRKFTLKFAGVALSTTAAIFLIYANALHGLPIACEDKPFCIDYAIYSVVRNIAFIVFHITSGRDAIRFKGCDRRGCKIAHKERRAA